MLFNNNEEVYNELGVKLSNRNYEVIRTVTSEIIAEYGDDVPLRDLEYLACLCVQSVFAPELVRKMVRVHKTERELNNV